MHLNCKLKNEKKETLKKRKKREKERGELHDHLLVEEIDVQSEVGEVDGTGAELDIKLVEVDVPQYHLPELLLQEELTHALDHARSRELPPREHP